MTKKGNTIYLNNQMVYEVTQKTFHDKYCMYRLYLNSLSFNYYVIYYCIAKLLKFTLNRC